jgi:hypothetical protein
MRAGGSSFHQLATLAAYSGAELPAVYFYYRSLAVAQPCQVAHENLLLLFEQNRLHYEQLACSAELAHGNHCSTAGGNSNPQQQQQQLQKTCIPTAALLSDLSTRFVRVHGALPLLPSIIRPSSNLLKFRFLKYPKNFKPLLQCPSCHIYACSDTTSPKLPGVAHCTR